MELSSASFAYPQHDGALRAELAKRLIGQDGIDPGLVLSTCLRIEVVVPGNELLLEGTLESLFGTLAAKSPPKIRMGEDAVKHLYRVAAGLDSPILGEHEVLTQFRQSLIKAEERGQVNGVLARLLETGVAVGRQARELLPSSPHNSMAAIAAQTMGTADRVAVLGSGIMATAVLEALLSLPAPPDITVLARHPEKVSEEPGIEVLAFDHAPQALESFPAIVSATSAKLPLIEDKTLAHVVASRKNPLLLIDMAMPPDFRPPTDGMVTYLDIDDLARMADRRSRSHEADALVEAAAVDAYRQYRDHHELGPLIGGLMTAADEIIEQTVQRFSGRLEEDADEPTMRQAVHTAVRTLLAGPVSYLKKEDRSPEAIDVIADAFAVDDA